MAHLTALSQALSVLGLSKNADHEIKITPEEAEGIIYITLSEETAEESEAWAKVAFTAGIVLEYTNDEYMDGYQYIFAGADICDIYNLNWKITKVDAVEHKNIFEPTDEDKAKITDIIQRHLFEQEITMQQVKDYYEDY